MNTRPGFSSVPLAGPGQRGHLIVLEGMPGAGKTTAAAALEEHGRQVAGEYTDDTGATIAAGDHPPAWDNDAHQQNWLRKTAQCGTWLSRGTTVYQDRDWLSSLSYAYSIGGTDAAVMLRQRAAWAVACLREGTLLLPACYVIFDLDPCTSLNRRSGRLTQAHPWNHPEALLRLRRFYADPVQALRPADQGLADILGGATRLQVCGCDDPQQILHQIMTVSGQP